jgi:hypothetical protein
MTPTTSDGKTKKDLNTSDYFVSLCEKYTNNIVFNKKMQKVDEDIVFVPEFWEHNHLLKYNYNVQQLKQFAKHYKLKVTGNKPQLLSRIYTFLFLSNSSIKIQKMIRGHLQRKYNKYHGPAFINRSICTNNFDFLSMEELKEIPKEQFFSYKDEDGFVYGFDLLSIYNLVHKCNGTAKNPFNTKPISTKVIENLRSLLRLSRVLNIQICTIIEDVTKDVSSKKSVELRALTLFQNIDALGNYSDVSWFMKLNRSQMIKFIRELVDIWSYRAPLTVETKRAICPPLGNPFSRGINFNYLQTTENLDDIRKYILDILEKFVNTGIDKDNKCLGTYYVLGALTLVSNDAATSLPWLFQAVSYM